MLSANKRSSRNKPVKEKNTALLISICIPVILFTLIILVIALPSIVEKKSIKDERAALSRLESLSKSVDKELTAPAPEKNRTIKKELPEADPDGMRAKESQDGAEGDVISGQDDIHSLVYTIQAGSFYDFHRAGKLYDSIMNKLNTEDLAYLRIEKVGQHYAVRLGKFGEQRHAKIFHEKIMSLLSTASIMKAFIKKERIKKLHSS